MTEENERFVCEWGLRYGLDEVMLDFPVCILVGEFMVEIYGIKLGENFKWMVKANWRCGSFERLTRDDKVVYRNEILKIAKRLLEK